ncbi:MAG: NAD(P)H-dependent oxidoreductase [Anaerolineae bacterium]|jgi:multimeric flavodoxin WrbA
MKAVILNGMAPENSPVPSIQDMLVDAVKERDWNVEPFVLHDLDVRPCGGCFGCWLQTPGRCVMDDTDEVAAAVAGSDLTIYLTPVTFGGYSSQLKKAVDHLIPLILPFFRTVNGETHHVPRYKKRANLLVLGVLPEHDAASEAIFTSLAARNATNMSAPRWAAGIIVEEQGWDATRRTIEDLLAEVEVI